MEDFLRRVPLFADLSPEDMSRLCAMVERVPLAAGQLLFEEGTDSDRVYVVETGELEVLKATAGRALLVDVRRSGDVIGEAALLDDTPRAATLRARTGCTVLAVGRAQLDSLLVTSPTAARVLLNTTMSRWRGMAAALRQSEKMAQLGTLTAGVAHELNNPASAVRRSADQLGQALTTWAAAQAAVARLPLSDEQRTVVDHHLDEVRGGIVPKPPASALERSDLEAACEDWLVERGVVTPWDVAPPLVRLGYDVDRLDRLAEGLGEPAAVRSVVACLAAMAAAYGLLAEIGDGAGRISAIVDVLKSYAYLDQAPVQSLDIHQGLENTLALLSSRHGHIAVRRDYADDLPRVEGHGSELNQVWTHLLDNAIDALDGTADPEIVIRTRCSGDEVTVEIEDNGPGIAPDIQPRVFDAFFTTKPPGQGAGLGLDVSYRIVADKHGGDIELASRPGRTSFTVVLPLRPGAAAAS